MGGLLRLLNFTSFAYNIWQIVLGASKGEGPVESESEIETFDKITAGVIGGVHGSVRVRKTVSEWAQACHS